VRSLDPLSMSLCNIRIFESQHGSRRRDVFIPTSPRCLSRVFMMVRKTEAASEHSDPLGENAQVDALSAHGSIRIQSRIVCVTLRFLSLPPPPPPLSLSLSLSLSLTLSLSPRLIEPRDRFNAVIVENKRRVTTRHCEILSPDT